MCMHPIAVDVDAPLPTPEKRCFCIRGRVLSPIDPYQGRFKAERWPFLQLLRGRFFTLLSLWLSDSAPPFLPTIPYNNKRSKPSLYGRCHLRLLRGVLGHHVCYRNVRSFNDLDKVRNFLQPPEIRDTYTREAVQDGSVLFNREIYTYLHNKPVELMQI